MTKITDESGDECTAIHHANEVGSDHASSARRDDGVESGQAVLAQTNRLSKAVAPDWLPVAWFSPVALVRGRTASVQIQN